MLESRYHALRPGLDALRSARTQDPVAAYGGEAPAAIARTCLAATRPILAAIARGCAEGRITGTPAGLAVSWVHMHCNRLGFDLPAEAILRYVMCRFYEDAGRVAAS